MAAHVKCALHAVFALFTRGANLEMFIGEDEFELLVGLILVAHTGMETTDFVMGVVDETRRRLVFRLF